MKPQPATHYTPLLIGGTVGADSPGNNLVDAKCSKKDSGREGQVFLTTTLFKTVFHIPCTLIRVLITNMQMRNCFDGELAWVGKKVPPLDASVNSRSGGIFSLDY